MIQDQSTICNGMHMVRNHHYCLIDSYLIISIFSSLYLKAAFFSTLADLLVEAPRHFKMEEPFEWSIFPIQRYMFVLWPTISLWISRCKRFNVTRSGKSWAGNSTTHHTGFRHVHVGVKHSMCFLSMEHMGLITAYWSKTWLGYIMNVGAEYWQYVSTCAALHVHVRVVYERQGSIVLNCV